MDNENKKEDILGLLLSGERITKKIKTRGGEFEIAFPLPSDLRKIELAVSDRINGKPISSFTDAALSDMRIYSILDTVIVSGPEWWEKLESSENCPDNTLIRELYGSYLRLYTETQKTLAKSKYDNPIGKIKSKDSDETMGSGAFQGITNK